MFAAEAVFLVFVLNQVNTPLGPLAFARRIR